MEDINFYVSKYGEEYRKLICDSLKWLELHEKQWNVKIDRNIFLEETIANEKSEIE